MLARLTMNVPPDLRQRARSIATARGETVTDVMRTALEKYVAELELEREAAAEQPYLQDGDPVFDLVGLGQGRYTDVSSDKYRYFAEVFG